VSIDDLVALQKNTGLSGFCQKPTNWWVCYRASFLWRIPTKTTSFYN